MADITAQMVKEIRDRTGAPFIDCKKALEDANDDSCRAIYAAISKDHSKHIQMLEEEVERHKEKNKWD